MFIVKSLWKLARKHAHTTAHKWWYLIVTAKCDDTVYYEPDDGDASIAPEGWEDRPEEQEEYPVMRRRSRSVGSVPLFLRKPDTHPTTK